MIGVQMRVEGRLVGIATDRRAFVPLPLLGLVLCIAAAGGLLFARLDAFPLNNDEAIYVLYAHTAAYAHNIRDLFGAFAYGVPPLFIWIGALALHIHPDHAAQLVTSRSISALCGLATVVGVYVLAWQLYRDAGLGLLAAVLYAFCPYAVLFNRLGLLDASVQFIGVLVALQSVRVFRQQPASIRSAILLGTLLGLGQLAKGISVFFWLLPVLAWYVFAPDRALSRLVRTALVATPVAAALYATILASGRPRNLLEPFFTAIKYSVASSPTHSNFDRARFPILAYFSHNLEQWLSWQQHYVGYAILLALAGALVMSARSRSPGDRFLALWLVIPLVLMLFTKVYNSRYIVFTVPIEILLVSRTSVLLLRAAWPVLRGRARPPRPVLLAGTWATAVLLLLGALYTARFDAAHDAALVGDPVHASYDSFDRWYYIEGWLSGYGLDTVESFIRRQAQHHDLTLVVDKYHLPLVALSYDFSDDPHVRLQEAFSPAGLWLPPGALPARSRVFALLDVPKDDLQAVRAVHPSWKIVLTQRKPGGQSAFVLLSNAS
jgi:4-amino-4-deoxy-L-arabinose transferase-like glycosyltransferase